MSHQIYNEGRVVGYSAYEVYVRQALSQDPTHQPATELEWLSSSIAMGSSMLLKIEADEIRGHHYRDFQLPSNTNLAAANTIIGSFFLGEAECDSIGWAKKVTSYGPLLSNTASSSPNIGNHDHTTIEKPTSLTTPLTDVQKNQLLNYVKLVDGIVIQPGQWKATSSTPPKDLVKPNMGDYPRVRLFFSDVILEDFYILLTGFTLRTVLKGVSGLDGSTDTQNNMNENGAFLGPGVFPWANKIVFSVPSAYVSYFLDRNYTRRFSVNCAPFKSDGRTNLEDPHKRVDRIPVIDMETTDPKTYYESYDSNSRVALQVDEYNVTSGDAVLTVYQRSSAFPPALFGEKVSADGSSYSNPIDTVAPGTLKMFNANDRTEAFEKSANFQDKIPNNYALFRDLNDYVVRQVDHTVADKASDWVDLPVADTYVDSIYGALQTSEATSSYFIEQHNEGDPSDYAAPTTLVNRRVRGKVSSKFKSDFGIDPNISTQYNFLRMLMSPVNRADNNQKDIKLNVSMYDYVKTNSPDSDPNQWKSKYFFILRGFSSASTSTTYMNAHSIIPVAKADSSDIVPSNTFDYIYKAYGPLCRIPVVLPTSKYQADTAHTYGEYIGGYWDKEGPRNNDSLDKYLKDVKHISPVALADPYRKVPTISNDSDWETVYKQKTLRSFVSEVIADAKLRNVISSDVTVEDVLNGDFSYTFTNSQNESVIVDYQKIANKYWDLSLYEVLELGKYEDLTTGAVLSGGTKFEEHFIPMSKLILNIKLTDSSSGSSTDRTYKLSNAPSSTIDWDSPDDIMIKITSSSAPSDWLTYFRHYFTRSTDSHGNPVYTHLTGDSAPEWDNNKYYKQRYELLSIQYDSSLTLQTSVQRNSPKVTAMQWSTPEDQEKYSFKDGPLATTNIAGLHQTRALSVADATGQIYNMSGDSGTITDMADGNIHWEDLLRALVNNKAIDVFNTQRFLDEVYRAAKNKLAAGDGISFTEDDVNKILTIAVKTNTTKGMAMDNAGLYTNFAPNSEQGVGIEVTYVGGKVVITNTMPDYSNGNYTALEYGEDKDFTINSPNNFTVTGNRISVSVAPSGDRGVIAIKVSFSPDSSYTMPGNDDFGEFSWIRERQDYKHLTTSIKPDDWNSAWGDYYQYVSGAYKKLSEIYIAQPAYEANKFYEYTWVGSLESTRPAAGSATYNQYHSSTTSGHFAFKHTLKSDLACKKANVVNIKFTDSCIKWLFDPKNTVDRRTKYRFEDTTGATSGIWNISNAERASWSAACGLRGNRRYYKNGNLFNHDEFSDASSDISIIAFSYADGYNSQFPNCYNANAYSDHINLEVSGVFRYRG